MSAEKDWAEEDQVHHLGLLSNGLMKNHLKCHYIELAHYTDGKKSKSVPNQYQTPIPKESPTSTKQTEDKPWAWFDEDTANS